MILAMTLGECRVWNDLPFGDKMPITPDKVIYLTIELILSNFKL